MCYYEPVKTYTSVLLDWDGNIAKTLDIWLEACRIPLMKRGFMLSDEAIASSFGGFQEYAAQLGIADGETALEEADAIARTLLPDVELYPDALEVLENLHGRGKQLALITSTWHANIDGVLKRYRLDQLFNVVVTGDDVTHIKPHAEPLEKALRALDTSKETAIMVGDSDKDLGAAVNTGVDSVLFYPPEHRKYYQLEHLQTHRPTYVIQDFRKLLDIVA